LGVCPGGAGRNWQGGAPYKPHDGGVLNAIEVQANIYKIDSSLNGFSEKNKWEGKVLTT